VPPVRGPVNKVITTRPVTDAMLRNPDPGDWLMYRRTYDGQSYSPLDRINRNNVRSGTCLVVGIEKGTSPSVDDWVCPSCTTGSCFSACPAVCALDAATGDFLRTSRMARRFAGEPGHPQRIVLYEDRASFTPPMERSTPSTSGRNEGVQPPAVRMKNRASGHRAAVGKIISGGAGRAAAALSARSMPGPARRGASHHDPGEPGGDTWTVPPEKRGGSSGNPWITSTTTRTFD
jgi:alcohol dehydrogenase (cytochrome c)